MIRSATLLCLALALVAGCRRPQGKVLGKAPHGEPVSILAIKAGDTPSQVTLSGVLVEKCPISGCWFRLRDNKGIIKVDTKSAGFVVVNIPLESKLTVRGKVVTEGQDMVIEAAGVRY